ncbi:hypothetical protein D3C80_1853100 [compost metagenome]
MASRHSGSVLNPSRLRFDDSTQDFQGIARSVTLFGQLGAQGYGRFLPLCGGFLLQLQCFAQPLNLPRIGAGVEGYHLNALSLQVARIIGMSGELLAVVVSPAIGLALVLLGRR